MSLVGCRDQEEAVVKGLKRLNIDSSMACLCYRECNAFCRYLFLRGLANLDGSWTIQPFAKSDLCKSAIRLKRNKKQYNKSTFIALNLHHMTDSKTDRYLVCIVHQVSTH